MKKVAGKLRLELASFRELASFAQFASDLDESTQRKIEKGKRLVEMLKQPNNDPIPFNKQVVLIYAGINDYLNEMPVNKVLDFEKALYQKLDTVYADLTKKIIDKKTLEDDIEKEMIEVIKEVIEEMKL
jgi:F-type H+-transporting ATPase subunit alpha